MCYGTAGKARLDGKKVLKLFLSLSFFCPIFSTFTFLAHMSMKLSK